MKGLKNKIVFLAAVFAATAALMAVQKPLFLACYATEGVTAADWWQVVGHGLALDFTVAGYVTVVPWLLVLLSLWVSLPQRAARVALTLYFAAVSLFAAAVFAVDLGLYEHWGFRLDATILVYLADPAEAVKSVEWGTGLLHTLYFALCAAAMIALYVRAVRLFDGRRVGWRVALPGTLGILLLGGLDFLAIRGGTEASVANVSKVYFSPNMLLNHAAVNPVFSFLSTVGQRTDYAAAYPFYEEEERAERFEALRGNRTGEGPDERVLRRERPNVVVVLLESFARTIMEAEVDGEPVMPQMRRLRGEGLWFENFFASSFRTDRGEVAVLSGFPSQTLLSVMKLPAKAATLPSMARSLAAEGYKTSFTYGGDLNFTNQAAYLYATGWQQLHWQKNLHFDTPPADWGYDDRVMCDWFADRVIEWSAGEQPFLAGMLTLSSHVPFDVPYDRFEDRMLNAMAFSDDCVGRMIERWKASPAWDDLLVILVADHGYPYPKTLAYNEPMRHRIPMIWTGGAVAGPRTVGTYASQIDICATLLGQLGIAHDDFDYSKDIFSDDTPKFAYYTFNEGFGVVDASGEALWDAASGVRMPADGATPPPTGLIDIGRTMLQTTYADIARR